MSKDRYLVGIDFGTTNSLVAYEAVGQHVVRLGNKTILPTVVSFDTASGKPIVGQKELLVSAPERAFGSFAGNG